MNRAHTVAVSAPQAPEMFQAPVGVLDLGTLNPGDPVVVSVDLPDAAKGTLVAVSFNGTVVATLAIEVTDLYVYDVEVPVSASIPMGDCAVTYTVQPPGQSPSSPSASLAIKIIDTRPHFPVRHTCSALGFYTSGQLDVWLVPASYRLVEGQALTVRTLFEGESPAGQVVLPILLTRKGSNNPQEIGEIEFDGFSTTWRGVIYTASMDVERGDLLSISVPVNGAQLNWTLSI